MFQIGDRVKHTVDNSCGVIIREHTHVYDSLYGDSPWWNVLWSLPSREIDIPYPEKYLRSDEDPFVKWVKSIHANN